MPESEIVVDGALGSDVWKKGEKESKTGYIEGGAITANAGASTGFFSFYVAIGSTLVLDDAGDIVSGGDKARVPRGIWKYLFMTRSETENEPKVKEFQFEKLSEFTISRQKSMK